MEQIMKKAIAGLDVDYAEIRLESSKSTVLSYMGPVLENIGTSLSMGGCVRICEKGGWGFASFNRIENAEKSALSAREMAKLTSRDKTVLAPINPVIDNISDHVETYPDSIPLEEKVHLLEKYNNLMINEKEIVTTNVNYLDRNKDIWLHTSEGTMLHQEKVHAGVSFSAVAKDGANIQSGRKSFGDTRGYDSVLNHEEDVIDVIKITRDLMKAPKIEGGVYTVILDPQLAGVFAHEAFGHLSESDFIYENPQARETMKIGRRFGSEILNIIDDGTLKGENGYTAYDDEGVKGEKTYLIKDGVLNDRLHSRETAGHMGENPTGNARALNSFYRPIVRMTNTYIDKSDSNLEEMIASVKNGVYACGFLGGNTDLERFTFSSAYAFKIKNGEITTPLRDVIISGNVFETLGNITMIGNDLSLFGGLGGCGKGGQMPLPVSDGSPHICIKNVLIG